MAVRNATLDVLVDVAASGLDNFDAVGSSARSLATDLDDAAAKADNAAGRFDGMADSADNLDSKAAAATGAMGALSSGFELIGADKAAAGLQSAAMATDFLSGAGQALNLVMDLEIVKKTAAAAATVAHTTATTAQSAASKAAAGAQWLLNAALTANPLGIVIALVAGLAAAVVIAYKRSDEFREKVDAAMAVAKAAFDAVSDAVSGLVGWLRDKVPPAFSWIKDKASGVIEAAFSPVDTAKSAFEALRDFVRDKIEPAVTTMKDAVVPVLEKLATPINAAVSAVKDLVSWIGNIDWPSPPKWLDKIPGVNLSKGNFSLGPTTSTTTAVAPTSDPAVIGLLTAILNVLTAASATRSTPVDTSTLARLLADVLRREGLIFGGVS